MKFHDLRYTAATLLLMLCKHPKVVQERMGHTSFKITMDVHSHTVPGMQEHVANRLDAFFKEL